MKLLCGVVQLGLDVQAGGEVRVPQVTGADGVTRRLAEHGHDRTVVTRLGDVVVRRIAYRSGVKGVPSLFPRDAVLNLPLRGYSWQLQRLAEMFCRSVSFEQGHEFVRAATGVSVGKRQLEQIVTGAAADAERFCQDRGRDRCVVPPPGSRRERPCRRWRSRPMPRAWRCALRAAAAGPRPRVSGCGPLTSGPGPGRRRAASGWPRRSRLRRHRAGAAADPRAGHAPRS